MRDLSAVADMFIGPKGIRNILVHPKDPVPPEKVNGVVYRISCNDCDMAYVGQTGRTLNHHRSEHIRALQNADPNLSAVEHSIQRDHNTAWDGAEILARNPCLVQKVCHGSMVHSF